MIAERFKRFNRSSYARRTNGVCEGAAFGIDVNFKIGGSCADKAWIFDEYAFICEKRDASKSGCRLVTEIAATNGDYISIDRRCWGVDVRYYVKMGFAAFNRLLKCRRECCNAVGSNGSRYFPVVFSDGEATCYGCFRSAGNKFVEVGGVRTVNATAGIPLAIPHGDKAISDIRIIPDESDFFSDDLHSHAPIFAEGFTERGSRGGSLPLIPQSRVTLLMLGSTYDRRLGCCRNHARFSIPMAKKEGECNNRANRRLAQFHRNGQNHCRIARGFRRHINRVVGYGSGFFVRSLPRHRDFVDALGIVEVRAAHDNLGSRQNLLVIRAAKSLQMLDCRANASFFYARPAEFFRFAAKVGLRLDADMDFVISAKTASFRVDGSAELRMDTQESVQENITAVTSETLECFQKSVYDAVVRVELPAGNVLVLHREAHRSCRIVTFLVDDQRAKNGLREILWIDPRHHAVAQGWLFSRCNISHILASINILGIRRNHVHQHSPMRRDSLQRPFRWNGAIISKYAYFAKYL